MQDRLKRFSGFKTTVAYPGGVIANVSAMEFQENFSVGPGLGNVVGDRKTANDIRHTREVLSCWRGNRWRVVRSDGTTDEETYGNWGSYPAMPFSNLDSVGNNTYNQALGRLYDQARNGTDWSVTAGQSSQVTRMLKQAIQLVGYVRRFRLKDLKRWYRDFRRTPYGDVIRGIFRGAGSKWLEFQYGWKPLAQDIFDTLDQLFRYIPNTLKIRGRATERSSGSFSENFDLSVGLLKYKALWMRSERVEIRADYVIEPNALLSLSNYTSLNPASIWWELTPFTFVFDWFVDVGGYVRELETACLMNSSFRGGYVTEGSLTRCVSEPVTGTITTASYDYVYRFSGGSNLVTYKKRTKLTTSPLPRVPKFSADLGASRLLNAAALLSQFLGGRPSRSIGLSGH